MRLKFGKFVGFAVAAAIAVPALGAPSALASSGGVHFAFPQPPIAPAGSIPAGGSLSFTLRVTNAGAPDPGVTAYLCQCLDSPGVADSVPGDSTTVPAAQCGGTGVLPSNGSLLACVTDSVGQVVLTYHVPTNTVAQGRADWIAVSDTTSHPAHKALQHYVYCTVYRFDASPVAQSGSLTPGASVPVTLTAEDGLDAGIANTAYVSFQATSGGGSASVGTTKLSTTPTLFQTDSSGAVSITYTAPATLPSSGADVITVSDAAKSGSTETNTDSYSFASATPVISIGDVSIVEGDQKDIHHHGITAEFTVTISPAQPNPVTLDYQTLCGVGDKGCGEDFTQVTKATPFTIPANSNSTILPIIQFSYVGGNAGETYNEGWYMLLSNPGTGVLGRSVGEGILLPDVEGSTTPLPDLYVGDVGLVPITNGGGAPMYFVVTLGAQETNTVTFSYATSNGTAIAGTDYTATSGVGSIPPGDTSAIITVNLLPNSPPSSDKTFTLTISNVSGGLTIARAIGTGTILMAQQGSPSSGVTFLKTLAGQSEAAMYPSGLIWDAHGNRLVVADTGFNRVSVFTPSTCPTPPATCTPTLSFGSYGSAGGQFNTPRDVAVDGSSNIYVADAANSRIEAFSSTGTYLWSAGGSGKLPQDLNVPIGLSYDPSTNEILVADTGHSLIKAYAAVGGAEGFTAGAYIWESPGGIMKSPREVRRGPDGEIWVADYHNEEVKAFQCTCTSSSSDWNSTPNKYLGDGKAGGHANGELNSPYNVAFSPDGTTAYVADTGNERIAVFDISGCSGSCTWMTNYGARCPKVCPLPPGNAGYFQALRRITVDPSGNLWAADFWGSGIHEFTAAGATGTEIDGAPAPAPGFAEAYGVAVGSNGVTYGVDRLNQRVEEFSGSGSYLTDEGKRGTAAGDYSWPETASVAPDGTVWVGDTRNNRLEHFAAGLTTPPLVIVTGGSPVGAFNYIEGVSVDSGGVVWVADTDNNRIVTYNPADSTFAAFGTRGTSSVIGSPAQFIDPQGVVATSSDFYVADTGNNRVDEVDMSGNLVAVFKTGLTGPQGIALAPDGTVWVANTGADQIVQLSANLSSALTSFGSLGSGTTNFNLPHSLAVSGSTLFVADTYNNRIQEFTLG